MHGLWPLDYLQHAKMQHTKAEMHMRHYLLHVMLASSPSEVPNELMQNDQLRWLFFLILIGFLSVEI